MSKQGYIYILMNPSFPQYLKIGQTTRTPEERAKELYWQAKTGIPTRFVEAYEEEVSDCILVEKLVHTKLEKNHWNKEFFNVPLKDAFKTIRKVIEDLQKEQKLDFLDKTVKGPLKNKEWWNALSFVWQQIFRNHLNLSYQPNELDLFSAVHNIIDHCQDTELRKQVADLIADILFTKRLTKWYNEILSPTQKKLFNSYLPYELAEQEIEQIFKLTEINCSNNRVVIDLKPLEKLSELKKIEASNTSILDLAPLKNLGTLEEICITNTQVYDLKPLETLPRLKKVTWVHAHLSKEDEEEIKRFENETNRKVDHKSFLSPYNAD